LTWFPTLGVQTPMTSGLPAHLGALLTPQAYPHAVDTIELIETHISWVLLTGPFAYKIKRPVHYAFVDLRSLERRSFCCAEEVRLNRRFAPALYLGVCAVTAREGRARIAGDGPVIERAVRMQQFRREEELDRLLAAAKIEPAELERFGRDLAGSHSQLPVAASSPTRGQGGVIRAGVLENLNQCALAAAIMGNRFPFDALTGPLIRMLAAAQPWMNARLQAGRVRECHGDLHCRNVVRLGARLAAFDCIEFDPELRWIDVADEIAFLLADLEARGSRRHAQAFFQGYLDRSGDFQACRVLTPYKVHRALVRAKVAALDASNASDIGAFERARTEHLRYVGSAMHTLTPSKPKLILVVGLSGSGKTWLAHDLASYLSAVHLRSDLERKRLSGLAEQARSASAVAEGLYSPDVSTRVYEHLAHCVADVLGGGYPAIVDAAFLRRDQRARFRELATALNVQLYVFHCHAPAQLLRTRIRERALHGTDASEADLSVLTWQQAHQDPLHADEGFAIINVDTGVGAPIAELLRGLAAQPERASPHRSSAV
jgi:uncharacterized protein